MVIAEAPAGASFRVVRVMTGKEVGKRLADMGFTEGAEGAVVRGGFLRGPFQIRIRGYDLLIRRSEAAEIEVEPIGDWSAARDAARHGRGHWGGGHGAGRGHGHGQGIGRGHGCDRCGGDE
jgi:Fe2+ transport system protein FeoA